MEVKKDELQRVVAECTVFSEYSISFESWSSTYYLYFSFPIFELSWSAFNKIEEVNSRPATLPKNVCTKEVFLKVHQNPQCIFNKV